MRDNLSKHDRLVMRGWDYLVTQRALTPAELSFYAQLMIRMEIKQNSVSF